MILNKLHVEREQWGEHKGQYIGKIEFAGQAGDVSLNLTPELCKKIFDVCADGLIVTAKEAAKNLTCAIIEQSSAKQISND